MNKGHERAHGLEWAMRVGGASLPTAVEPTFVGKTSVGRQRAPGHQATKKAKGHDTIGDAWPQRIVQLGDKKKRISGARIIRNLIADSINAPEWLKQIADGLEDKLEDLYNKGDKQEEN